jgi:hypothetical protein
MQATVRAVNLNLSIGILIRKLSSRLELPHAMNGVKMLHINTPIRLDPTKSVREQIFLIQPILTAQMHRIHGTQIPD